MSYAAVIYEHEQTSKQNKRSEKKTIYRSNSMNIIHDPLCAGTNFFSLPSIKPDDKINEKYWCAAVV